MLNDEEMHARMAKGWRMGRPFTVCGNGSTLASTANVRGWLPGVCVRHGIRSVCDAGAGDLSWIRHMVWDVQYRPFDLIRWKEGVTQIDFTREALPPCDLILCRMVLNHLDDERIAMALRLFRQSGKYLAATQFHREHFSGPFSRLDLREGPYDLGNPLEWVADSAGPSAHGCKLALWRL